MSFELWEPDVLDARISGHKALSRAEKAGKQESRSSEVSQTRRCGSKSKRRFGSESIDPGAILRVSERISSAEKAVSWSREVFTGILPAACRLSI